MRHPPVRRQPRGLCKHISINASTCCSRPACSGSAVAGHAVETAGEVAAVLEELVTFAAARVALAISSSVTSTKKARQPCLILFLALAQLSANLGSRPKQSEYLAFLESWKNWKNSGRGSASLPSESHVKVSGELPCHLAISFSILVHKVCVLDALRLGLSPCWSS